MGQLYAVPLFDHLLDDQILPRLSGFEQDEVIPELMKFAEALRKLSSNPRFVDVLISYTQCHVASRWELRNNTMRMFWILIIL